MIANACWPLQGDAKHREIVQITPLVPHQGFTNDCGVHTVIYFAGLFFQTDRFTRRILRAATADPGPLPVPVSSSLTRRRMGGPTKRPQRHSEGQNEQSCPNCEAPRFALPPAVKGDDQVASLKGDEQVALCLS